MDLITIKWVARSKYQVIRARIFPTQVVALTCNAQDHGTIIAYPRSPDRVLDSSQTVNEFAFVHTKTRPSKANTPSVSTS